MATTTKLRSPSRGSRAAPAASEHKARRLLASACTRRICHATAACGRARSISALQALTRSSISCVDCLHGPPLRTANIYTSRLLYGRLSRHPTASHSCKNSSSLANFSTETGKRQASGGHRSTTRQQLCRRLNLHATHEGAPAHLTLSDACSRAFISWVPCGRSFRNQG